MNKTQRTQNTQVCEGMVYLDLYSMFLFLKKINVSLRSEFERRQYCTVAGFWEIIFVNICF